MEAFWEWFSGAASQFGEAFENEALLHRLDEMVAALGDFAWEVGPGRDGKRVFVLSPGGDRELLERTQAIINAAPDLPGWEFQDAKPPKAWEPRFVLHDAAGAEVWIDASEWRCALLKYKDGTHEVLVLATGLDALDDDYRRWAAEILIDGVLGERRRLEVVDEVTVVSTLSDRENQAAFPVIELRTRLGEDVPP